MELRIIQFMNARLLVITTILLLVISGCGQSYNPELDKDCNGCDLSRADLRLADLPEAELQNGNLTGADLSGIDLTGANLTHTTIEPRQLAKVYRCSAETINGEVTLWITIIRRIYELFPEEVICKQQITRAN